ncbi:MAG: sugar ABC transporter substrate-binding protein [Spirochaetaceae bacterium]
MKKNLVVFLMIFLSTVLVFAEGQKEVAQEGTDASSELLAFFNGFTDDVAFSTVIDEYLDLNPDIKLEISDVVDEDEAAKKIVVLMASGVPVDIIKVNNPIKLNNFVEAGALMNLNDLAKKYDVNPDEYWGSGKNMLMNNGDLYAMGTQKTQWAMYYNKDLFDRAGLPYPSADVPMTWKEYRETAKKLTMGEGVDKTYGALHLKWPMFWYMSAIQKLGGGEQFYNADGTSNIEDPAFIEAITMFNNMQAVDKSVPSYADVTAQKLNSPSFLSGKYGMYVHGTWVFDWLKNPEDYPRDWKVGIAPMPVFEGAKTPYSWGVVSGISIGRNSENSDEAFKFIKYMVDNKHKYYDGGAVTANVKADTSNVAALMAEGLEADGITTEILQKVFFNPKTNIVTEKITGKNSTQYEKICVEELEKYFVGAQEFDVTIENIKTRADKAIK